MFSTRIVTEEDFERGGRKGKREKEGGERGRKEREKRGRKEREDREETERERGREREGEREGGGIK